MSYLLKAVSKERVIDVIQWTGNNLKDVISLTGKNERFDDWFSSFEDYEDFVRNSGNIFKIFGKNGCTDVPVGWYILSNKQGKGGWALSVSDFEKEYRLI